jgi:hypothetical protein
VRNLRKPRQGTVLVEFVVLLPLFVLILAGVMYLFRSYEGKQLAMLKARSCGWQFALHGCETPPEDCSVGDADQGEKGVDQALAQLKDGSVIDAAIQLPVIGSAIKALFGVGTRGSASTSVSRPPLLGGGEVKYAGTFYVLCNTVHRTLGDTAKETFCSLIPRGLAEKLSACTPFVAQSDQLDKLYEQAPDSE